MRGSTLRKKLRKRERREEVVTEQANEIIGVLSRVATDAARKNPSF